MLRPLSSLFATVLFLGSVASGVAQTRGALETRVAQLEREREALTESLVAANQREKESAEALAKIKLRLSALDKNLFEIGDDRLVEAVASFEVLNRRVRELEETSLKLSAGIQAYLKTAVAADPDARVLVEVRLRELEALLGLRSKPQANISLGSLRQSQVDSVDSNSGLLILNVGEQAGAKIGMVFEITRGQELVADAVIAETRDNLSGLLVQRLFNEAVPVQLGDLASLKTQ